MNKPFELSSKYSPAGDQPTAINGLVKGIEAGLLKQTLLGVTGSGKTYTMANVIARCGRPAIIMAHNKTLAAQLYGEFKEFFPNNSVEYFVSYYDYYQPEAYVPASDTFIDKDASVNEHIEQMRLSATKALMERRDAIIVCTVSAIYGLGDPDSYLKMMLHLVVVIRSISVTFCADWPSYSTPVTTPIFTGEPIGYGEKSSIFSLLKVMTKPFALSCLTTRWSKSAHLTR